MKFSVWLEKRGMFNPNNSWRYKTKTSGLMGSVNRAHRLKSLDRKNKRHELNAEEKEKEQR